MKHSAIRLVTALLIIAALASSCSRTIGWGLVLWPPEGSALGYGEAVPVYFMSNITRTYAVEVPATGGKEELELWRLELHKNKKSAEQREEEYAALAPIFGLVARDGLILRTEATNIAEQVYRLKLDEEVKLLAKTEGAPVETGGERLPGDWYLALAADGTRGYIYSNQLMLWDASREPRPSIASSDLLISAQEADLFEKTWRPDYFLSMVDRSQVDLGGYQQRFGIFTDPQRRQIRIERPEFSKFYSYTAIERQEDGSFILQPSGLRFSFTQGGELLITPPVEDLRPEDKLAAEESGVPRSFVFVQQREDPRAVITAEERRRLGLLSALVADGELFETESGGSLVLSRTGRFTWLGYESLSPAPIPAESGTTGNIAMDLFLGPELTSIWQGAFTLRFDANLDQPISFAYRAGPYAMELGYIAPELMRNGVVTAPQGLDSSIAFSRYR